MNDHLQEQINYYRERAAEYDDWWMRQGSYALDPDLQHQWDRDVAQVEMAVHDFAPTGDVLELACGTGLFTRHIARYANHITALDSSPEVIAINRARLPDAHIEYVIDDVFTWPFPVCAYDQVVFTYWLSHVPDDRLDAFWGNVRTALKQNGRAFLVDSFTLPSSAPAGSKRSTEHRTLNDGRSFDVVKRYWTPVELEGYLSQRGWSCQATLTDNGMILWANVSPA